MDKIWPSTLLKRKQSAIKIVVLTAYDFSTARILEESEVEVILVGDSLGNVIGGLDNTLGVTMEQMLYHTGIVKKGLAKSLLIADMPFLSFQVSPTAALINAGRFIKEAGAAAVKMEGGREVLKEKLPGIVHAGIPVMGHLGLTPQSINRFGGYRVQGRDENSRKKILEDALFLQEEGCFAIVLEGIPESLGKEITEKLIIPTIGIGAGRYTDGQILVFQDLLGFSEKVPKFVRKYANINSIMKQGVEKFVQDVQSGEFPSKEEVYE